MSKKCLLGVRLAHSTTYVDVLFVCIFVITTIFAQNLWSQETQAVIQPGNQTLKFTNTINQPVVDIRVKDQAVPVNGDYVIRITSKSPTQATVVGNAATNIVADGLTWNKLTGLMEVEIIFEQDAALAIGDECQVTVEDGPYGKDNRIGLRLPPYSFQEPDRVFKTGVFTTYKNSDRGYMRSLLQFDLFNLPSCATILSAEILVFPYNNIWYREDNPDGAGLVMHRILKSWNEGTADGINDAIINGVTGYERWFGDNQITGNPEDWEKLGLAAGTDYEATHQSSTLLFTTLGPGGSSNPNKFFALDVTQLVKDWHDGTYENYGVLFKSVHR